MMFKVLVRRVYRVEHVEVLYVKASSPEDAVYKSYENEEDVAEVREVDRELLTEKVEDVECLPEEAEYEGEEESF